MKIQVKFDYNTPCWRLSVYFSSVVMKIVARFLVAGLIVSGIVALFYVYRTCPAQRTSHTFLAHELLHAAKIEVPEIHPSAKRVLPRVATYSDPGRKGLFRGWVDAQCQGVKNDFCRYVGTPPLLYFSCTLAGANSGSMKTPPNMYVEDDFEGGVHKLCKFNQFNPKPIVTILIPMTSRNSNFTSLDSTPLFNISLPSIAETLASSEFDIRVYAGYDNTDEFWRVHSPPSSQLDFHGIPVHFIECECATMVCNTNCLARIAYYNSSDFIFRSNDDTQFLTSNWVTPMVLALQQLYPPYFGAVGPVCQQGNAFIMTHDFTHRSHMQTFGRNYYPVSLENWFVDDWITRVYGRERTIKLLSVEVKHGLVTSRYIPNLNLENTFLVELQHGKDVIDRILPKDTPRGTYDFSWPSHANANESFVWDGTSVRRLQTA